jgi:hypothetical protein
LLPAPASSSTSGEATVDQFGLATNPVQVVDRRFGSCRHSLPSPKNTARAQSGQNPVGLAFPAVFLHPNPNRASILKKYERFSM